MSNLHKKPEDEGQQSSREQAMTSNKSLRYFERISDEKGKEIAETQAKTGGDDSLGFPMQHGQSITGEAVETGEATQPIGEKKAEEVGGELTNPGVEQTAPSGFRYGNQEFKTSEEMLSYIKGLGQNSVDSVDESSKVIDEVAPAQTPLNDDLATQMLIDPEGTLDRLVNERLNQRFNERDEAQKAEAARQEATKKFWDEFYNKNEDLKLFQEEVELVRAKHLDEWKELPLDIGSAKLAETTRKFIDSILYRKNGEIEEVGKESAHTISGGTGVKVEAPVVREDPVDFLTQFKKFQKRG